VLAAYRWCSAAVVALAVAGVRCDSQEEASRCRIWLNSASSVVGLTRKASAPAARARSSSARPLFVVTTRIGTLRVVESRRRSSHSAWPSKNGSSISVSTSAGWPSMLSQAHLGHRTLHNLTPDVFQQLPVQRTGMPVGFNNQDSTGDTAVVLEHRDHWYTTRNILKRSTSPRSRGGKFS